MRIASLVGVLLVAAGGYLLWKRPTYSTRQDVVQIGDFKASVKQQQGIPLWVGGGLLALGVACLLLPSRRGS